jgi:hypothetical protein
VLDQAPWTRHPVRAGRGERVARRALRLGIAWLAATTHSRGLLVTLHTLPSASRSPRRTHPQAHVRLLTTKRALSILLRSALVKPLLARNNVTFNTARRSLPRCLRQTAAPVDGVAAETFMCVFFGSATASECSTACGIARQCRFLAIRGLEMAVKAVSSHLHASLTLA